MGKAYTLTERRDGHPSQDLLYHSTNIRERTLVRMLWQTTVPDNGVDLCVRLLLDFRVEHHDKDEGYDGRKSLFVEQSDPNSLAQQTRIPYPPLLPIRMNVKKSGINEGCHEGQTYQDTWLLLLSSLHLHHQGTHPRHFHESRTMRLTRWPSRWPLIFWK